MQHEDSERLRHLVFTRLLFQTIISEALLSAVGPEGEHIENRSD